MQLQNEPPVPLQAIRTPNQQITRTIPRVLPATAGLGPQQSPPYYGGMFPRSPQPTTGASLLTTPSVLSAAGIVTGSNYGLQSAFYPEMAMLPPISPLQSTTVANLPDITQLQATSSLPVPKPAICQPSALHAQPPTQGSSSLSASVGPGTATVPLPLSLRISLLNLKLLTTETSHKSSEIQNFYHLKAAQIENERYQTLQASYSKPWQLTSIEQIYDQEHSALISHVEDMCRILDTKSEGSQFASPQPSNTSSTSNMKSSAQGPQSPKTPSLLSIDSAVLSSNTQTNKTRRSRLTATAISIMERWYQQNEEHPYPNQDTTQLLATSGNISPEQVKKWFANRRLRKGDTKKLSEIARRRKRPLDSQDSYTKRMRQL